MSEILIRDIEMPKKGNVGILIYADGSIEVCGKGTLSKPIYGTPTTRAIEVPTHGRLGDLDALQKQIEDDIEAVAKEKGKVGLRELWQILNKNLENAPTIIEVSKGRK